MLPLSPSYQHLSKSGRNPLTKVINIMAEKAYITPKVFKWARESARISVDDAAKKVNISPEIHE